MQANRHAVHINILISRNYFIIEVGYKYLIILVFITNVFCNNSSIQGLITDSSSGDHLLGANIMLDGTILGAASDENGFYSITDIPIGTYTVKAMFIGYETLEKEIEIKYRDKRGNITTRKVDIFECTHTHLIGYCFKVNDRRTFLRSGILELKRLEFEKD